MKQKTTDRYWNGRERPATKAEFFNAVTTPAPSGDGTVATIRLYGPIDSWGGWWGISTKDVGQVLDELPDTVEQIVLRINSPGGEVFEGVAILNMLRAHKATVTAVVDGLAASAASVIAAGCDELVMSPGTQLMIHSPSVWTWGNSTDLRKDADILDGIEASIIEVYTDKAGAKDWATLLAEETWMTAAEAVESGLADRVGVVPDAGDAATVGEDDPDIFVIQPTEDDEDDEAENLARGRYASLHERFAAIAPKTPVSSEPVEPQKKEDRVSDTLKAGLRERLGLTDADASDEALLAAVDELTEAATAPTPPVAPAGTTLIDSAQLTQLQADAQAGREARDAQIRARREQIVNDALADGRIAPANRGGWLAQLEANEEIATKLLADLPKGAVPVDELGHSDTITSAEDALYARVYPTKEA